MLIRHEAGALPHPLPGHSTRLTHSDEIYRYTVKRRPIFHPQANGKLMEIQANIPQMLDKPLWSYPSFSSESEFRHKVASRGTSVAPETTGTPDGGNRILKPGKVLGSPIWSKTLVDVGQHFHVVGYLSFLSEWPHFGPVLPNPPNQLCPKAQPNPSAGEFIGILGSPATPDRASIGGSKFEQSCRIF